jgi:hypothetical protein
MGSFFASSFERNFFKKAEFANDTIATNDLLQVVDPFNLSQPNFLLQSTSELKSGSSWLQAGLKENKKSFAASVYPNPVSKNATINLNLEKAQNITIALYDILGHKVAAIAQSQYSAGRNEIQYDASSLPRGMYFVQISDGAKSSSLKMIVK